MNIPDPNSYEGEAFALVWARCDRQVIVLEEGWDFDSPEAPEILWCDVHKAPQIDCDGATENDCRMVRKLLIDPPEQT